MISIHILKKIEQLSREKKFEELIKIADEFVDEKIRTPGLINIIGTSILLKKNRSHEEIEKALKYFEQAHLKGKNSPIELLGICNLITACLQNRRVDFVESYIFKSEKYYLNVENKFDQDENFLKVGHELFRHLLDHEKISEISNKILKLDNLKSTIKRSNCLFSNLYNYDWSQKEHFEQAIINSKFLTKFKCKDIKSINYKNSKKIKIGFVSGDFKTNHSVTYFIKNTLKYIDRKKFDISVFSFAKTNEEDKSQKSIKELADEWYDINNVNNQNVINLIQEKKIFLLFDIMGFTHSGMVSIFNSRIAPVQISWLAYCNTLGFETIDYLIADKNVILPDEEKYYSEKIIKLPDIWNAHSGFDFETKYIEPPSIKNEHFTFGSFNNFRKISYEVIDTWSKILQQVPNSKLILKSSTHFNSQKLLNRFKNHGVLSQVHILNRFDFEIKEHLDLYKSIDLALDTFPYNGVTTTFESLWMNVPVLVLKGFNFNSRCGESIIQNSKLDYLISSDTDDYIKKAVFLAQDKDKLKNIKKELSEKISSSTLFDNKKFTKNFEQSMLDVVDKQNL